MGPRVAEILDSANLQKPASGEETRVGHCGRHGSRPATTLVRAASAALTSPTEAKTASLYTPTAGRERAPRTAELVWPRPPQSFKTKNAATAGGAKNGLPRGESKVR